MKNLRLMNSKGISVLFLVIAMLLMVTIGYVFSYLIPTKQKSVIFPIQSNQAFFIAQSGVEFAVRYAADNNWTTTVLLDANLNGVTRDLGSGRFTLTYNYATYGDTLISVGEVPIGTEKRRISVSNFTTFLTKQLILSTPPVPCLRSILVGKKTVHKAEFYIRNQGSTSVTLDSFTASWTQNPPTRQIDLISLGGTTKFSGNYVNDAAREYFNVGTPPTYTINAGQTILVEVRFTGLVNNLGNMIVNFYSTTGEAYDFRLDPEGDGFPPC